MKLHPPITDNEREMYWFLLRELFDSKFEIKKDSVIIPAQSIWSLVLDSNW